MGKCSKTSRSCPLLQHTSLIDACPLPVFPSQIQPLPCSYPRIALCRGSNINWQSIPLPTPCRELWDEMAQEISNHDKEVLARLQSSRKSLLNEAKNNRNRALRLTAMDHGTAESNVYRDYLSFFEINEVGLINASTLLVTCL